MMGFWLAMMGCNLIVPVIMIVVGLVGANEPPDQINHIYGYRTSMSMKNQETWDFAQVHSGKTWWKVGCVMLPLSVFVMLPTFGKTDNTIGIVTAVLAAVQCAVLILAIVPTELALRKHFDKDGNRRG